MHLFWTMYLIKKLDPLGEIIPIHRSICRNNYCSLKPLKRPCNIQNNIKFALFMVRQKYMLKSTQ